MTIKRVSINISLPSQDYKDRVEKYCGEEDTSPSKEFVKHFERLFRKKK